MSVQTEITRMQNAKAAIKAAIEGKGVTVPDATLLDGMAPLIASIKTGGGSGGGTTGSVGPKDVNFYDYDGALVASYTLAEAQALTALPDGPAHDGLVFQGWNWSLEKINALTRPMNVGAMYITDDGKTRLHIRIAAEGRMNVPLYISQTVANGVTIDWGDGSATQTLAGTGNVNTTHTYASIGDYTITLDPADGCKLGFGWNSSSYCVLGSTGNNGKVYCNLLQAVNIGKNVTSIGTYALQYCSSLASITIPDGVTSIGSYAFGNCNSLASITIPDSVTSIGSSMSNNCNSLASITIPDSVTSIGSSSFQYCSSLASITIPDSVTSIGSSALQYCSSLASITIPDNVTSIGSNVFESCNSLSSVTISGSVTSIGDYAFQSCSSLASITIPDGVTSIGNREFRLCYSLASVTIPGSVTRISDYAFGQCYGMAEYHLKPTTPPTLSSTNAFNGIPSDCIIYVPQGCLEAYQNATNWATYASKMQEEPA